MDTSKAIARLFSSAGGLGVAGCELCEANRRKRELALRRENHALRVALEVQQQAWAARVAMQLEADQIRRELGHGQ